MPRKKLGFDQRLNFWVSQESYDFYNEMAEKRGDKLSELLREVLDYAKGFFDEEGRFELEAKSDQEWVRQIATEAAAEEVEKKQKAGLDKQVEAYLADMANRIFAKEISELLGETPEAKAKMEKALRNVADQFDNPPSHKRRRSLELDPDESEKVDA